jgi:uncharacterized protein (TIGR03663 family)
MTRGGVGALVTLALVAGLALRLVRLDVRPMHHDEANQGVKFGLLLEHGEYRYDAHDHHGPTLYYLTLPAAWLRGQHTVDALDERTLRGVTVAFGAATILLLPLLSRGIGPTAVAASAWLLALSPAMVFYSRMFIQESMFTFFTLGFAIALGHLATGGGRAWSLGAGVWAGLAVATKETSAIVLPAAVLACVIAWWSLGPERPPLWRRIRGSAAVVIGIAAAVAALFYSSFLTFPAGIVEPFRGVSTYLNRGVDPATHVQPWYYYLRLLALSRSGGLRWSEGLVLALAAVGAVSTWGVSRAQRGTAQADLKVGATPVAPSFSSADRAQSRDLPRAVSTLSERVFWARYLTCNVVLTAAIFSAIKYKTPWNLLPFHAGAIVLAGLGFVTLVHATSSRLLRGAVIASFVVVSGQLGWQAWRASVTYAADSRNPYVYAQTVPDAVRMAARIRDLAAVHRDGPRMQVSVIAPAYEQWPLPWYLRTMPHVGYWTEPGDPVALEAPVIVASMDNTAALNGLLGDRYVSEFFGLRPEVLLALYVERGLWDRFLARTWDPASAGLTGTWDPALAGLTDSRLAPSVVRCGCAPAVALWRAASAP